MKLCPFCGNKARCNVKHPALANGRRDTLYQIKCTNDRCGVATRWWYPKRAAIWTWNKRTSNKVKSHSLKNILYYNDEGNNQ